MRSIYSEEYQTAIGRLVEARKVAGLTQAQVAARWGREQSIVAKIESCVRRLDIVEFVAISLIINADALEIVGNLKAEFIKRSK